MKTKNKKFYIISISIICFISLFLLIFLYKIFTFPKITKIELIYNEEAIIQNVSNIRLDLLQIEIYYDDDTIERKTVTSEMVSKKDQESLLNAGLHEITISYQREEVTINIFTFDDTYMKENQIYLLHNLENLEVHENIDTKQNPIKEGYYFAGWYTDEECKELYIPQTGSYGVQKLYAAWSRKPVYTVRFMLDENTCLKEEKVVEGASATPPEISSNNQTIFIGWNQSFQNVQHDLILYAQFSVPTVEVYFIGNDNVTLAHYVVEKGTNVIPPVAPEIEGYVFVGWSRETNDVTENTIVYAIYQQNMMTYYYDSDLQTILYILSSNETPIEPIKEGMRFDKWVEIINPQSGNKSYYATYKELGSNLRLYIEDTYETLDGKKKNYIDIFINDEIIQYVDIYDITNTFYSNNNDKYIFYETFISRITGIYGKYEWYTDQYFENGINTNFQKYIELIQTSEDALRCDYVLFGKKTFDYKINYNLFNYTLDDKTNTYGISYIENSILSDGEYCDIIIPKTYLGKEITKILSLEVPNNAIVYIDANITNIDIQNVNICSGFIVSEENKYYESFNGILLDINNHAIAKMSNINKYTSLFSLSKYHEVDILGNQEEIRSCLKTDYDLIASYSFDEFFNKNSLAKLSSIIQFFDGIKIAKNAFVNNSTLNLAFLGSYQLIDEVTNGNYFGIEKTSLLKISFLNLEEYSSELIISMFNPFLENLENLYQIVLSVSGIKPLPNILSEEDIEYKELLKVANYYANKLERSSTITYEQISKIYIN